MIHHALVLNLHQPWGNLDELRTNPITHWEPEEILYAYDRIPRAVEDYQDVARVHLAMSGTLLEVLSDPDFQSRYYGVVKCGDLLWKLRNSSALDFLGTGFYHPVLALIPEADRDEHVGRWCGIANHLLGRNFSGFWPPELGFSMELIPLLRRHGFRYVIVDSEQVIAKSPMKWDELRYRPHIASYGGEEIVVIVRDRDLSIAQEGGMEPGWFIHEVHERTKWCDFDPLVCTATDGDNGGWFRNTNNNSNYWGAFYHPLCDHARSEEAIVRPTFIHDYLDQHGVHGEVIVRTGAWNTGDHNGIGFMQWTGSQMQKDAWKRLPEISQAVHDARWTTGERGWPTQESHLVEQAMWHLLRAETSCHFFWGEAWVQRCHDDLDAALDHLKELRKFTN